MQMASMRIDQANSLTVASNTLKQDTKIRKNWTDWCALKRFADNDTVYETKIWLYVEETLVKTNADGTLIPRLSKKSKKSPKPISESVVRAHLAALQKLYKYQRDEFKQNSHEQPNTEKQGKFKKAMSKLKKTVMVENHLDRGEGSLFDGYCTQKELNSICTVAFRDTSLQSLRTRVFCC